MKVVLTSKNLSASDHLRDTIESKFSKLSKYFSNDIDANVTLSMEKGRQKIEATIWANGTIFRAEDTTNDIYSGIDKVVDKLSSQMSKFKSKLIKKHKDSKTILFDDLPEEAEEELRIVKTKQFDLLPMSAEEAVLQMELLQHDFFVFMDMDTEQIGVVYRRKDGDYGLLQTKN
ncbi:MAG: ribosome-associated translation inhibitor RaiA [Clostridiales Family XIII bacterium]|jgi:putative sigma-54 modulation protein|nr:ribosome-associated translation inhibitor RaiA [Clostridiales Family XIII bacterium]